MKPDGSDPKDIAKTKSTGAYSQIKGVGSPHWSPSGDYLLYQYWEIFQSAESYVYRVKADGSGSAQLASGAPKAWRE
jgi:hypothetical protein